MVEPTTRAYTLKLNGEDDWREKLWKTHLAVNRGAQVWGDWLLTLRGGLSASLAQDDSQRRVLLALSWMSVESPASLAPSAHVVTNDIEDRFRQILERLNIKDQSVWITDCMPALSARIRDDAVWVDRSACFTELQSRHKGLSPDWASATLFALLGGETDYFTMPDAEAAPATEGKDFVQKAGGWLSRNWGSGEKSDSSAIGTTLAQLASIGPGEVVGKSGTAAMAEMLATLGKALAPDATAAEHFKQLKQTIGWKGRPSKGAIALEKLRDAEIVSVDLWQLVVAKMLEESEDQGGKSAAIGTRPEWMGNWRTEMESRLGMPYRSSRDLIWEHGVTLDHALRRVSAGHTWIKRAEAERRRFREDAAKIEAVPLSAREWLDSFCEQRSLESGALDYYFIRKRAIDGWEKVVDAWADLRPDATRSDRIAAAREVQANLDDNEKFGDIQLFAGFGDESDDIPRPCLADDVATCVWQDATGKPTIAILKNYVDATVAEHDQQRFKVPAYRHPDPLRNPIYVDFGNSRWGISYSALKAVQHRKRWTEQLATAKTEKARCKVQEQLNTPLNLRQVTLDVWDGQELSALPLRWQGKRLWKDLDLAHFGTQKDGQTVSRADRLGRIAASQPECSAVTVAEVFGQKDWNGRLQVPRKQLDRLADVVYGKTNGKRNEADYAKLDQLLDTPQARKFWERLDWFVTTSAKLQPQGPWLDFVKSMPQGIAYRKGRSGYYLDYAANKDRKGRARLQLARLPGLRVLSLDLGHRYAAACAVWETLSREQMVDACNAAARPEPNSDEPYLHLQRQTGKLQKSGSRKGEPVFETTVYRRIGPDILPDGSAHPAPWARLERQFLIKLQGEDRPARVPLPDEIVAVNEFCATLGLPQLEGSPRIDELHKETVWQARSGLRQLGDVARIAFTMTATKKPTTGGREPELSPSQRVDYLQDSLLLWHRLAGSGGDVWAKQLWQAWIVQKFGGPEFIAISDELTRPEQKKRTQKIRDQLRAIAEQLADPTSANAVELHRLWMEEWQTRDARLKKQLRWLRRFVLPRSNDWKAHGKALRGMGGLSVLRLQTIRNLYQVLKAFRMRPAPTDLRKNVPELGDESLARFGRRILNQLERLREQRIKQLASRVVEAALGAGRLKRSQTRDRKRHGSAVDRPCHAVVVENLEHYRPEDSRLRRENRQLMDWAARNVRKYLVEGCQLYGLHFAEVMPAYTSKTDSRTGSPGIRCEDVSRKVLENAAQKASSITDEASTEVSSKTQFDRDVARWTRELRRIKKLKPEELSSRDQVLLSVVESIGSLPANRPAIRLPRRGGEIFVSSSTTSKSGIQADLNAAANIGIKALMDPDWIGAWTFVLVEGSTGQPVREKVQGCPVWTSEPVLVAPASSEVGAANGKKRGKKSRKSGGYAWNPRLNVESFGENWLTTAEYWKRVEQEGADRLRTIQTQLENPF